MILLNNRQVQITPDGQEFTGNGLTVKSSETVSESVLGQKMASNVTAHGFTSRLSETSPVGSVVMATYKGKAILEGIEGSTSLGNYYNDGEQEIVQRIIRSGRDTQDKSFYTELLMNNRAILQTGYGDLSQGTPLPPSSETSITQQNSYLKLFYPNGNALIEYGPDGETGRRGKTVFRNANGVECFYFQAEAGSGANYTSIYVGERNHDYVSYYNHAKNIEIGSSNYSTVNVNGTVNISNDSINNTKNVNIATGYGGYDKNIKIGNNSSANKTTNIEIGCYSGGPYDTISIGTNKANRHTINIGTAGSNQQQISIGNGVTGGHTQVNGDLHVTGNVIAKNIPALSLPTGTTDVSGTYVLKAIVIMVDNTPQITYQWVKE